MSNLTQYLPPFLSALLLSLGLTVIVEKFSLKHRLLKIPRSRDFHQKALPRLGGVAIFLAFFIISLIWFNLGSQSPHFTRLTIFGVDRKLFGILFGSLIIVGVMLYDDLRGLSPFKKLIAQIAVALIIIASGAGIDTISNPFGAPINLNSVYLPIFSYQGMVFHFSLRSDLLTLIWLVGMMNVVNFIDGIDGLAAGLSGIGAIIIFLLSASLAVNQPATALISIILAGAVVGFLPRNFYPAKIFMGDSGSMFLGLMLGTLTLISGGKLATVFLVLGFVIVDGLVVTLGRVMRRQNPFSTPDKTHLHHRFIDAGFSVRQAVITLYIIAVLFGWVALRSSAKTKLEASAILVILILSLIYFLIKMKERRNKVISN